MQHTNRSEGFWSDTYRGHTIAVLNHGGRWLVYLDHVLQHRMLFETAEAAVNWLHCLLYTSDAADDLLWQLYGLLRPLHHTGGARAR